MEFSGRGYTNEILRKVCKEKTSSKSCDPCPLNYYVCGLVVLRQQFWLQMGIVSLLKGANYCSDNIKSGCYLQDGLQVVLN